MPGPNKKEEQSAGEKPEDTTTKVKVDDVADRLAALDEYEDRGVDPRNPTPPRKFFTKK